MYSVILVRKKFVLHLKWDSLTVQGRSETASNGQHAFGLQSQIRTGHVLDSKFMCKTTDHCGLSNVSECNESAYGNVVHLRSEESDLFKKHFGSLSSTHKVCTFNLTCISTLQDENFNWVRSPCLGLSWKEAV